MADERDDDAGEKTNLFQTNTHKIKVDPDLKVPPCLMLVVGPATELGKQWPIDKAAVTVGRNPQYDVSLTEPSLSKSHAKIETVGEGVFIIDQASTNQTLLNGTKLVPFQRYKLKNNDQIRMGALMFKFLERGIVSETAEKERMQSELETAREVQEHLLPQRPDVRYGNLHIGGLYRSATECGGDWWWHWASGDKAFALIGDATGHGAASAMITSAARSAIGTIEPDPATDLGRVYTTLSRAIRACSGAKLLMSAFIVEYDFKSATARFLNASHFPAVLLPRRTGLKWTDIEIVMNPISAPMGGPELEAQAGVIGSLGGKRLILLTDGIAERKNAQGQAPRERVFYEMLVKAHAENPDSPMDFLKVLCESSDALADFTPQDDDITVVALDFD